MARKTRERDRTSLMAYSAFWLVIIVACLAGLGVVRALGLGGAPAAVKAKQVHRVVHHPRQAPKVTALTINSIFAAHGPSLAGYTPSQLIHLIATGDVIPARSVNYKMFEYHDYLYPFRRTAVYLRSGDITLINLESPLIAGCPLVDSGFTFCGDPRAVEGLRFAGVDVACTANNHIGNYGSPGIQETWLHLRAAGIQPCGLGNTAYRTVKGVRFAFLAFNCVGQRFDYAEARREIRAARRQAQVVVVSVHWGKEYVSFPTIAPGIADDDPRKVGHWIIDSGADLVIGNHPHHVQGVEMYHGHLITFAHGNFVFDQMFSDPPGARDGVVGSYTFAGRRLVAVRYHVIRIYDYSQPRWATVAQSRAVLAGMRQSTRELVARP
ncbi:MAG: CapA family protein [Chloroflexota bacterium]